jgi:hypothetical protein
MKKGDLIKRNRDGRLGIIGNDNLTMITWCDDNVCCVDWDFIETKNGIRKICDDNFTVVKKQCLLCDCKCHCNG